VQEQVGGLIEDLQRSLLVDGHDLGTELWADAADGSRSQVTLDALGRRRMAGLDLLGLELLAVLPVDNPLPLADLLQLPLR
jgi:hypothetical protein